MRTRHSTLARPGALSMNDTRELGARDSNRALPHRGTTFRNRQLVPLLALVSVCLPVNAVGQQQIDNPCTVSEEGVTYDCDFQEEITVRASVPSIPFWRADYENEALWNSPLRRYRPRYVEKKLYRCADGTTVLDRKACPAGSPKPGVPTCREGCFLGSDAHGQPECKCPEAETGAAADIIGGVVKSAFAIFGSSSCKNNRALETMLWAPLAISSRPGRLGDLTNAEVRSIQSVVDRGQRPLDVVGSAARGTRRGVGTNLPIGKGPGTRSDIDYTIHSRYLDDGSFTGLSLPSLAPGGALRGPWNPFEGPSIRFEPGVPPRICPMRQ